MTTHVMRIKLMSTTDPEQSYIITVDRVHKLVDCTCTGFRTHGYCKHIKFYKKIIQEFIKKGEG